MATDSELNHVQRDKGESRKPVSSDQIFKIRIIGSVMIVERLPAPRMRFLITLDKNIPEISRISLIDECSADYIARSVRKINKILVDYSKRLLKI